MSKATSPTRPPAHAYTRRWAGFLEKRGKREGKGEGKGTSVHVDTIAKQRIMQLLTLRIGLRKVFPGHEVHHRCFAEGKTERAERHVAVQKTALVYQP